MTLEDALSSLRHAFANGRLAHAFLVLGHPRGEGLAFAKRVCQLVFCASPRPDGSACGQCKACQDAVAQKSPDALWIEPEKRSRVIDTDTVRETVNPWVFTTAFLGGWKVLVVLFADRFNASAANVFLKTLEEPPPKTLILLVTDHPGEVLGTIVSRCQTIDLANGRVPPAEPWRTRCGQILAQHATNPSEITVFATASRFMALLAEIEEQAKAEVAEDHNEDINEDSDAITARIRAKTLEIRRSVFVAIQDWYRDLYALASGAGPDVELCFPEFADVLRERASRADSRHALAWLNTADEIALYFDVRFMPPASVLPYWFGRLG